LLIFEKIIISKTNTGPRHKNAWGGHKKDPKNTRNKKNAASNSCWQSVQDPCRFVFENYRCAWNRSL